MQKKALRIRLVVDGKDRGFMSFIPLFQTWRYDKKEDMPNTTQWLYIAFMKYNRGEFEPEIDDNLNYYSCKVSISSDEIIGIY